MEGLRLRLMRGCGAYRVRAIPAGADADRGEDARDPAKGAAGEVGGREGRRLFRPDGKGAEQDLDRDEAGPGRGESGENGIHGRESRQRAHGREDENENDDGPDPVREVEAHAAALELVRGGPEAAEDGREVGDREAGPRVPHDGAEDDLDVDRGGGEERRSETRFSTSSTFEERFSSSGRERGRAVSSVHVFEHMSATTAVRAKTISARAACAEEIAGGRRRRTVRPPKNGLRQNRRKRGDAEQLDRSSSFLRKTASPSRGLPMWRRPPR